MIILSHTSHNANGRADIMADGGTPQERIVGQSKRTINHHASGTRPYVYDIRATDGRVVYSGSSMGEGLKRLAADLERQGEVERRC